jgi:hypothetical protein
MTGVLTDNLYPSGSIVQVKQAYATTAHIYTSSNTWFNLGGLQVDITPKLSNSQMLISGQLGCVDHEQNTYLVVFRYARYQGNITKVIGVGANVGRVGCTAVRGTATGDANGIISSVLPQFLDSPGASSQISYFVQANNYNGGNFYYNRDKGNNENFPSTLTVMEIAP